MNVQELADMAGKTINKGEKTVQLVLPPRSKQTKKRYLYGKVAHSPQGTVVGFDKDGEIVDFNAIDLLAFCVLNGAKVVVWDSKGNRVL